MLLEPIIYQIYSVYKRTLSSEFSVGPLEGLKVGLVGLGPLNWVGQKVGLLLPFLLNNRQSLIQVIRGVISENISYILLVQGKELIRYVGRPKKSKRLLGAVCPWVQKSEPSQAPQPT